MKLNFFRRSPLVGEPVMLFSGLMFFVHKQIVLDENADARAIEKMILRNGGEVCVHFSHFFFFFAFIIIFSLLVGYWYFFADFFFVAYSVEYETIPWW
jgi:hypothetical protein